MAIVLALTKLFDDVAARFTAEGTAATNVFGWREPVRQAVGNRIVWAPGDFHGKAGSMLPARNPGRVPRPLATLGEYCTVYFSTADTAALTDERAQYVAARLLYDAWVRAVYLAAHGTYVLQDPEWIVDKNERRYGAALRVVIAVQAEIPDQPPELAPTDAVYVGPDALLNVSETLHVAPTDT